MTNLRYNHLRPAHRVGMMFLAAGRKSGNFRMTRRQIEARIERSAWGKPSAKHPTGLSQYVSKYIWNLSSGNDGHGGAEFLCEYDPLNLKRVIAYTLLTPERMNNYGQVVTFTKAQRLAAKRYERTEIAFVPAPVLPMIDHTEVLMIEGPVHHVVDQQMAVA